MMRFGWLTCWQKTKKSVGNKVPLREFVYLDEVSLRSLLSSQAGEITDSTSKETAATFEAEVSSSINAGVPQISNSGFASRFQTSNSSTLQTSRKATVQSWFRDFYNFSNLRLIEPAFAVERASEVSELIERKNSSEFVKSSELVRGKLVEFRVSLEPDPIFHLGTMVSELNGMAEDYPDMLLKNDGQATLEELKPVHKVLQRLLAGLIPIRAKAIEHVVVEVGGVDYVAHRDAIAGLKLEEKPLVIVGVTEHLAYWKDIRRVLFSEAEFTILCRMSRSGLQSSWTPVKLVDLFREFAPDLTKQIDTAGRSLFAGEVKSNPITDHGEVLLAKALDAYKDKILQYAGESLTGQQKSQLRNVIFAEASQPASVEGQRRAFSVVKGELFNLLGVEVEAKMDIKLRDEARKSSGLPLMPSLEKSEALIEHKPTKTPDDEGLRLLDVEIIAIYW